LGGWAESASAGLFSIGQLFVLMNNCGEAYIIDAKISNLVCFWNPVGVNFFILKMTCEHEPLADRNVVLTRKKSIFKNKKNRP